jgi:hypothetical protein
MPFKGSPCILMPPWTGLRAVKRDRVPVPGCFNFYGGEMRA